MQFNFCSYTLCWKEEQMQERRNYLVQFQYKYLVITERTTSTLLSEPINLTDAMRRYT